MSNEEKIARLFLAAYTLSDAEFMRMLERDRLKDDDLISIEDLAAERDKSVRTLRRRNNDPDAPKRIKRGRRLMYRRADVRHWPDSRARTPADGESVSYQLRLIGSQGWHGAPYTGA